MLITPDVVLDLPLDRLQFDPLAGDVQVERLVAARPDDRQLDLAAWSAAHLLDRLVQAEAIKELAIDVGDVIPRLDPRAIRRRILGRGDHLDRSVLARHG